MPLPGMTQQQRGTDPETGLPFGHIGAPAGAPAPVARGGTTARNRLAAGARALVVTIAALSQTDPQSVLIGLSLIARMGRRISLEVGRGTFYSDAARTVPYEDNATALTEENPSRTVYIGAAPLGSVVSSLTLSAESSRGAGDRRRFRVLFFGFRQTGGPIGILCWSDENTDLLAKLAQHEQNLVRIGGSVVMDASNYMVIESGPAFEEGEELSLVFECDLGVSSRRGAR